MRRMNRRRHRLAARLALIATVGVTFQAAGCQTNSSNVAYELSSVFFSTLISSYVNDQFGVSNSLFF